MVVIVKTEDHLHSLVEVLVEASDAVSYTHLDVYKRQDENNFIINIKYFIIMCGSSYRFFISERMFLRCSHSI